MKTRLLSTEQLHRIVLLARESRRALLLGGGALLAAVLLAVGVWAWLGARERAAEAVYGQALLHALAALEGAQASPAAVTAAAAELEAALAGYPSTATAPLAAYELGNLRYAARQYAQARSAYELALTKGAAGLFRALARAGIGYAWEAERDFAKAADAYRGALADARPGGPLAETLLLDLARAEELAGRKDEAIAAYRRALKEAPVGAPSTDVRAHLASLGVTP